MRRASLWRTGLAGATALVTVCAGTAGPAGAGPPPVTAGATASSMPAYVGTGSLTAKLNLTGAVSGLVKKLITPIVDDALNPLVNTLQGTLSTVVASTLGVSSSLVAPTPSLQSATTPGPFPADLPGGLPNPCGTGSPTQPCYQGTGPSSGVSLPSLVTLNVGALLGYTQQVTATPADSTNPIFGRAQVASTSLSVLPGLASLVSPLVSVGAVDSKANCPAAGNASASVSAANVSLLGGAIGLTLASGGTISTITIPNVGSSGSTSYTLSNLPTVAVAGTGFTLAAYGTALQLSMQLSLTNLLTALGLGNSIVSELLNDALPNTSLTLSVIVGPNTQVSSTSAKAWGLGIGVDLSGSLGFNLLGLVGATVSLPSAIGGGNYGNLLDARLAYTSCTSGAATSTTNPVVPPALI